MIVVRQRPISLTLVSISLVGFLAAGLLPDGSEEATAATRRNRTVRGQKLATGIRLFRIKDRRGPQRIFVLKVDPRTSASADLALSNEELAGFETTSSMGTRYGGIAAVNGDFGELSGNGVGSPVHDFARNGVLEQRRGFTLKNPSFGLARGKGSYLGNKRPTVELTIPATPGPISITRWNDGAPAEGELALLTAIGNDTPREDEHCSARLLIGGSRWRSGYNGVETTHEVVDTYCPADPTLPDPVPEDPVGPPDSQHVVLTARSETAEGDLIATLPLGSEVTLSWRMDGWFGTLDAVGGDPLLLKDGQIMVGSCSQSLCRRHPRTGIGVTSTGKLLLVVVDGRRKKAKGMTLLGFAREMKRLGAVSAINLDGGGSSTMWVRGMGIVNKPSDGRQRGVSSAIVVQRYPSMVLEPATPASASTSSSGSEASPGWKASEDPASTGGLLDALASGAFRAPIDLPPDLDRMLARFRAAAR